MTPNQRDALSLCRFSCQLLPQPKLMFDSGPCLVNLKTQHSFKRVFVHLWPNVAHNKSTLLAAFKTWRAKTNLILLHVFSEHDATSCQKPQVRFTNTSWIHLCVERDSIGLNEKKLGREPRTRAPFLFSVVYVSRGTESPNQKRNGERSVAPIAGPRKTHPWVF